MTNELRPLVQFRFWTFFHLYSAVLGIIIVNLTKDLQASENKSDVSLFLQFWVWSQLVAAGAELVSGKLADRISVKSMITIAQAFLSASTLFLLVAVVIGEFSPTLPFNPSVWLYLNQVCFGIGMACFAGKDKLLVHQAASARNNLKIADVENLETKSEVAKSTGNLIAATIGSLVYFGLIYLSKFPQFQEFNPTKAAPLLVLGGTIIAQIRAIILTRRITTIERRNRNQNSTKDSNIRWNEIRKSNLFRAISMSGIIEAVFLLLSAVSLISVYKLLYDIIEKTPKEDVWSLIWVGISILVVFIIFSAQKFGVILARKRRNHESNAEGWSFSIIAICVAALVVKICFSIIFAFSEVDEVPIGSQNLNLIILGIYVTTYIISEFSRANLRTTLQFVTHNVLQNENRFAMHSGFFMSLPGAMAKSLAFVVAVPFAYWGDAITHLIPKQTIPDNVTEALCSAVHQGAMIITILVVYLLFSRRDGADPRTRPSLERATHTEIRFVRDPNYLLGFIITALVASNLLGLFENQLPFGDLVFVLGAIPYAIAFSCFDIVMEVYGAASAKRLRRICLATYFFCLIIAGISFLFIDSSDEGFVWTRELLIQYVALLSGSLLSFYTSQEINSRIFFWIRGKTGSKRLFRRCFFSTLFAQLIDTIVFVEVAHSVSQNVFKTAGIDRISEASANLNLIGGQFIVKAILGFLSLFLFVLPLIWILRAKNPIDNTINLNTTNSP